MHGRVWPFSSAKAAGSSQSRAWDRLHFTDLYWRNRGLRQVDRRASQKRLQTRGCILKCELLSSFFLHSFRQKTYSIKHEAPRFTRIWSWCLNIFSTGRGNGTKLPREEVFNGWRPPAINTAPLKWPFAGRSGAGNYIGLAGSGAKRLSAFVDLITKGHNKLSSALWLNSLIMAFKKCVLQSETGQLDLKEARAAALNN